MLPLSPSARRHEQMNSRGIKYQFEQGERVLCFEPDPTKAKVLYDAKVIDVFLGKDEHGRRIPKYLIHFNGWNRSWDRWAAEDHVLRDTEENRKLQHKLARKALGRMKRKGWAKRRRRQSGTKSSLKTLPKEDDSDDACLISSSESSDGDDSEPESSNSGDSAFSEDINKMRVEPDINVKRECEEKAVHVDINIPEILKKKLEDDCFYINKRKKLVMVPCQTNVVHILESYVKHFAINKAFMANERYRRQQSSTQGSSPQPVPPDKSEDLCKEMVDGLRITFDFTLPMILLYPCEQAQFKKVSSSKLFMSVPEGSPCSSSAQRERSPSPPGHNPPTPQSTDSQPALSDISTTTPTPTAPTATPAPTPTPTPKRRRHPDMDCISYQSQSLRRSTRNTSGGERPAEGSSGGGGSTTASPQLKRRLVDSASQAKFILNFDRISRWAGSKSLTGHTWHPSRSLPTPAVRDASAQRLVVPAALHAEQRAEWTLLRPGEPQEQRAQRGAELEAHARQLPPEGPAPSSLLPVRGAPPPAPLREAPGDPGEDADPRQEPASPGQAPGTLPQVHGRVPRGLLPRDVVRVGV